VFPPDDGDGFRVHLCFGPNCTPRGSRALLPILQCAIFEAGIADKVEVIATSCRNRCEWGPSLNVYPGPVFYAEVTPEAIVEIVQQHLVGGRPVERYRFREQPVVIPTTGRRR
jgi:NADP-reducing hydrogenase subunit HndC